MSTTMISKMRVTDYQRWLAQFEEGANSREQFGVETISYGRVLSDQDTVVVILRVPSEPVGRQMLENPVLKKNLEDEGIEQLDVIFIER